MSPSPNRRATPCPPRIALLFENFQAAFGHPLIASDTSPIIHIVSHKSLSTLSTVANTQTFLEYFFLSCAQPSLCLLTTSTLHSDQCEEAKLSPTDKIVDSKRTTHPFDTLESTILALYSGNPPNIGVKAYCETTQTCSCAFDNLAPTHDQPSVVSSPLSTQPSPPANHIYPPCP